MKVNFRGVVAEAVKRRGTVTVAEVLADVGHLVPAARAVAEGRRVNTSLGRRLDQPTLERVGRRRIVSETLRRIMQDTGLIERLAPGRYRWAASLPLRPPRVG